MFELHINFTCILNTLNILCKFLFYFFLPLSLSNNFVFPWFSIFLNFRVIIFFVKYEIIDECLETLDFFYYILDIEYDLILFIYLLFYLDLFCKYWLVVKLLYTLYRHLVHDKQVFPCNMTPFFLFYLDFFFFFFFFCDCIPWFLLQTCLVSS